MRVRVEGRTHFPYSSVLARLMFPLKAFMIRTPGGTTLVFGSSFILHPSSLIPLHGRSPASTPCPVFCQKFFARPPPQAAPPPPHGLLVGAGPGRRQR